MLLFSIHFRQMEFIGVGKSIKCINMSDSSRFSWQLGLAALKVPWSQTSSSHLSRPRVSKNICKMISPSVRLSVAKRKFRHSTSSALTRPASLFFFSFFPGKIISWLIARSGSIWPSGSLDFPRKILALTPRFSGEHPFVLVFLEDRGRNPGVFSLDFSR